MRVKAKIDIWINMIMWLTMAIMVFAIFSLDQTERVIGIVLGIPVILFLLWMLFGTYYELWDTHLYCKSGPFFERIYYDRIKSLKLSRNMLSSMALSRDRIEIKQHGKGYIAGTTYISPVDRESFLIELKKRCGKLEEGE